MDFSWGSFNNREIATVIWFLVALTYLYFKDKNSLIKVAKSLWQAVKILARPKMLILNAVIILLISMIVVAFNQVGLWVWSDLKDTIIWALVVGFVMITNHQTFLKEDNHFLSAILKSITFVALLEFVLGVYVFRLWGELIFVPIATIITVMEVLAETKDEFKPMRKPLRFIIGFIGLCVIFFSFRSLIQDFENFVSLETLRSFLLPIAMTLAFTPVAYAIAVLFMYEQVFMRISFFVKDPKLARHAKWMITKKFRARIKDLNKWSTTPGAYRFQSKHELGELLQEQ